MGRKRHTPEQIITALREAEVGLALGKSVKLISRELGITEQTYIRGSSYRMRKHIDLSKILHSPLAEPSPSPPRKRRAKAKEKTTN